MVALDRSDADIALIKAAKVLASNNADTTIYFFHVLKSLEVPPEIYENYPNLAPIDEAIEANIQADIDSVFGDLEVTTQIDVREGNPTEKILKWINEKDIDLLLMAKKPLHEGSGHHKDKIVNAAHCSVLIIPQGYHFKVPKNILVSTDFSDASFYAFKQAMTFAKRYGSSITAFHSYEVPSGYHTTGKTYEEFADIMLKNAEEHFADFIAKADVGDIEVNALFELDEKGHPHKLMVEAVKRDLFDLIIIGSKGRTNFSSVLLGSVAAKLIKDEIQVPVLIVKKKAKNMDLLNAILQL
jgi:nucleotide-binding universal stress UspA family protein